MAQGYIGANPKPIRHNPTGHRILAAAGIRRQVKPKVLIIDPRRTAVFVPIYSTIRPTRIRPTVMLP